MHLKLAVLCLALASAPALAADTNTAQTSIPSSTKKIAPRSVVAPTITETRATRMPDGSLSLNCVDRPNPKARALIEQANTTHVVPDQQP